MVDGLTKGWRVTVLKILLFFFYFFFTILNILEVCICKPVKVLF